MASIIINVENYCIHAELENCSHDLIKSIQNRMEILELKAPSDSYIVLRLTEGKSGGFEASLTIHFLRGPIAVSTKNPLISKALDNLFKEAYKELTKWKILRFLKMTCA